MPGHLLAEPGHVPQAEPDGPIRLHHAVPDGVLHVDGREPHAVPLRILHDRRGMVEPHGLIVEECRVKRRRVVRLQIRARVDNQREAGGVRLREPIERKRRDRPDNLLGRPGVDALPRDPGTQLLLDLPHACLRALEPHRPAQLLGLAAGEPGRHHRHAQQLFLEEWHAKRALEDGLQRGVGIHHGLSPRPPVEIRVHHLSDDGSGPDDGHLHHEVVEPFRPETRQRGHLRARLDLEDANRVGLLQHPVDDRVVRRQAGHLERLERLVGRRRHLGPRPVDDDEGILQRRHHAEPEQVDLDEAHVGAVVLVPLHHHTARHRRVLERHHLVQSALADHHPARVLAEMARQVLYPLPQVHEVPDPRAVGSEAGFLEVTVEVVLGIHPFEVVHQLRQAVDAIGLDAQGLAHLARGTPPTVRDDVGGHARTMRAVLLVHALDDAFTAIAARQIEIDVGPLASLLREEPLEEQVHPHRVHRRDAEAVAHGAVCRRPTPLYKDAVLSAKIDDVPDDEEVPGEVELRDEIQLAGDLPPRTIVIRPVPLVRARLRDLPQKRHHRLARGHRIVGKTVAEVRHRVLQAIREITRGGYRLREIGKEAHHRLRRLQIPLGVDG